MAIIGAPHTHTHIRMSHGKEASTKPQRHDTSKNPHKKKKNDASHEQY